MGFFLEKRNYNGRKTTIDLSAGFKIATISKICGNVAQREST